MAQRYPDVCLQAFISSWWVEDGSGQISRGRLIWTLVPYPEMKPYRLLPIGRGTTARQHSTADYRIEAFRADDPPKGIATLPVAALPMRDGESLIVTRAKRRPAVVISTGGSSIPSALRQGAKGQSRNNCTILAADASRRASLLGAHIRRVCSLLAPRRAGASTPRDGTVIP